MKEKSPKPDTEIAELLLEKNKAWVAEQLAADPDYFKTLAQGQRPHSLWIGCADSRVPANVITGTRSGDIFVHRNIANVVVHDDLNMLSVLQYAVEVLEVQHVIVCGHYGCGGVNAALTRQHFGLIDGWLRFIKDVYHLHERELAAYSNSASLERRMVELNIIEGVRSLAKTSIVQRAWKERKSPVLHGWVYDLADGLLRDLGVTMSDARHIDDIYRYHFDK
jgi:carbonic anhydrase